MSFKGKKKERKKVAGVARRGNIFFMWQMASFYVRVMSSPLFMEWWRLLNKNSKRPVVKEGLRKIVNESRSFM